MTIHGAPLTAVVRPYWNLLPPEFALSRARVTLDAGEARSFERNGDLADRNAGLLIFDAGGSGREHVPWTDVVQIDVDRPASGSP